MISFGILKCVLFLNFLVYAASEQKYLELSVVVDNDAFNAFESSGVDPLTFVQKLVAAMDDFLEKQTGNQLGLSIVLTQTEVWSKKDLIDMTMNGESDIKGVMTRLQDFREEVLIPRRGWSDALLVVTTQNMGSNVGRYISGGVCDEAWAVGLLRAKNNIDYQHLAAVAMHELGHGMNMRHDSKTAEGCYDQCIMSPVPEWSKSKFSDASVASYENWLNGKDCLNNNPEKVLGVFTSPDSIGTCGNGIIEDGEECDCGYLQCDCCDYSTCKFRKSGDACYSYPSSGLNICTTGVCSGSSKDCTEGPAADYISCDEGKGQCYSGKCASTNLACKNVYTATKSLTSASNSYYQQINQAGTNKFYSSGGYYLIDLVGKNHIKTALLKGDGSIDGHCGALLCKLNTRRDNWQDNIMSCLKKPKAAAMDWCYKKRGKQSIELLKLVKENAAYKAYRPVLTDVGTPCMTSDNSPGHCVHDEYPMTEHLELLDKYYKGRCVAN